jgi:GntR family transcriptional regulator
MRKKPTPPRTLGLQLDFRSGLPIYLQIVQHVERRCTGAQRRLQPGDRLPTVRGLAAQLGVNFNTVARAYRLLAAAGVVSTQPGRGTYILERLRLRSPQSLPSLRSRQARLKALARRYVAQAQRLGFSEAEIRESMHLRS